MVKLRIVRRPSWLQKLLRHSIESMIAEVGPVTLTSSLSGAFVGAAKDLATLGFDLSFLCGLCGRDRMNYAICSHEDCPSRELHEAIESPFTCV